MSRKQIFLVLIAVGTLGGVWLHLSDDNPSSSRDQLASGVMVKPPVTPAPAPPHAEPSRKQEGGRAARFEWNRMRLADPATGRIPPDIHRREMAFARQLPRWERAAWIDSKLEQAEGGSAAGEKVTHWQVRGPYNVGGRTRAFAIDVSDPTLATLLAGGVSGGMWRSVDDGQSWLLTTGSSQLQSVSCIAQDTRAGHEHVWYYGTGEYIWNTADAVGAPYRGDGIFKSTDGGTTWALLPATSTGQPNEMDNPFNYVFRVVIDASEPTLDELYAATIGLIYRSTDGGDSFDEVLGNSDQLAPATDVVIASDGVLYASISSGSSEVGIYRSLDGLVWTDITPVDLLAAPRYVLALTPSDENILYVLAANVWGEPGGFYKYTYLFGDGSGSGGQWENRSATLAHLPGHNGPDSWAYESYDGFCAMVSVHPSDPDMVFLGGINLIRSSDGFATTEQTAWVGGWRYTDHHCDLHWLCYQPGSLDVAYTASDGGVHKTYDAAATPVVWQILNNGYNTSQFYTVAVDDSRVGSDIVIGGTQDNGSWWTGDVGDTPWVKKTGADGAYCAVAWTNASMGDYYFSIQYGVVYRFRIVSDGNTTLWTRVDPAGGGSYLGINPFILDPNDTRMMYLGSSNGVWRNTNLEQIPLWGEEPTHINWDHLTTVPVGQYVSALAMSRTPARILFYGTDDGRLYRLEGAATAEPGTMPTYLNPGTDLPDAAYVSSIAIHPEDDQRILVAYSNYNVESLWYSVDGGTSWTNVEGNLGGDDGPSIRSVAIVPDNRGDYFLAGTSTGLYSTTALEGPGTVWQMEAADIIGNVVVDMLATRPADGYVAVGTHGKGIYSAAIGVDVPQAPLATYLAQNAPNPFNPRTSISFNLPAAGPARLDVFDLAGRHVCTLLDERLGAGEHDVVWEGLDDAGHRVGSGTYLYRLQTDGFTQAKRMTLVR